MPLETLNDKKIKLSMHIAQYGKERGEKNAETKQKRLSIIRRKTTSSFLL